MRNHFINFVKFFAEKYIIVVEILFIALFVEADVGFLLYYANVNAGVIKLLFMVWGAVFALSAFFYVLSKILEAHFNKVPEIPMSDSKKKKIHKANATQKTKGIHKTYTYPEIEEKIEEIDKKLAEEYVFFGMKKEKWENTYKQEIFGLMRSEYEISDENQQKILRLLDRMNNNMVNQKEKEAELQAEVNIEAMERMADIDLVNECDFLIKK